MNAQAWIVDQRFESYSLSQSAPLENSLRRSGRQKNALFQKGLREQPETGLPARGPISFSFRPVSPTAGDYANLVPMLDFKEIQWLEGWRRRGEFESASGWRRERTKKHILCSVARLSHFYARPASQKVRSQSAGTSAAPFRQRSTTASWYHSSATSACSVRMIWRPG